MVCRGSAAGTDGSVAGEPWLTCVTFAGNRYVATLHFNLVRLAVHAELSAFVPSSIFAKLPGIFEIAFWREDKLTSCVDRRTCRLVIAVVCL